MIQKPDWKDAPEWAQYLAFESGEGNGGPVWLWFECKPGLQEGLWWMNYSGQSEVARYLALPPYCEQRPEGES